MKRIKGWFRTLFGSKDKAPVGPLARSGKKGVTVRQRIAAKQAENPSKLRKLYNQTQDSLRKAWDKLVEFLAPVGKVFRYVWAPVRSLARFTLGYVVAALWLIGLFVAPFATLAYTVLIAGGVFGYCVLTATLLESDNETAKNIGTVLRTVISVFGVMIDVAAVFTLTAATVAMPPAWMAVTLALDAFYVVLYNRNRSAQKVLAEQNQAIDEVLQTAAPAVA